MSRSATLLSALVAFTLASPVQAQGLFEQALAGDSETEAAASSSTASGGPSVELNGYVRGAMFAGKVPNQDDAETKAAYGEVAAKLTARLGTMGDAFAEVRFRNGLEDGQTSSRAEVREAWASAYLGPLDIRFGQQIIAWGRADAFNPTDNLTPKDMAIRSANEDDKRRPNLALRAFWNLSPVRLEGVWIPFFAASRFPAFAFDGPITFGEPAYPAADLTKGLGAGRLHLELPAFEGSLSYLIGYATFPGVALQELVPGTTPEARVGFKAYRHQVVGADFSTAVSDWFGLRGEAAWRDPLDDEDQAHVPASDVQVVLGMDKEIGDFWIILQVAGRYALDWDAIDDDDRLLGHGTPDPEAMSPEELAAMITRMDELVANELTYRNQMIARQTVAFGHTIVGRVQWTLLHETLSLELLGSFDVNTMEWMARPKLAYDIADGMEVVAGAELYGGPDETLFGMVDETMSAGFVELKASF